MPPPARRRVMSVSSDLDVPIIDCTPASAAVAATAVSPPKAAQKKKGCKLMLSSIYACVPKHTAQFSL